MVVKVSKVAIMNNPSSYREWDLGKFKITLTEENGWWELETQTFEHDLLTSIVDLYYPDLSQYILDIIFERVSFADWRDAMRAYAIKPLQPAPPDYLALCRETDWGSTSDKVHRAIVLAESKDESDRKYLLEILENSREDIRDGALWAASSICDLRFVNSLAKIAMSVDEPTSFSTGELRIHTFAFNRWRQLGFLTTKEIEDTLRKYENNDNCYMRVERMMNYIECPFWSHLPYPEEMPYGYDRCN